MLYAGGTFTNLDRLTTADGVALYTPDGGWQGLSPTPIGGIVRSLHANGTNVYIGTDGLNVGGIAQADHLVKWDGAATRARRQQHRRRERLVPLHRPTSTR